MRPLLPIVLAGCCAACAPAAPTPVSARADGAPRDVQTALVREEPWERTLRINLGDDNELVVRTQRQYRRE